VEGVEVGVGEGGAGGVVGIVDEDELGVLVGEAFDLVDVDGEVIFFADGVGAGLDAEGFGEGGEGGVAGLGEDDVGAGLGCEPHEDEESFGCSGDYLDGVGRDLLHVGDGGAEGGGAGGTAVGEAVGLEEAAVFVGAEGEELIERPGGAGAGG